MLTKKITIAMSGIILFCLFIGSHGAYAADDVTIITCECLPLSYMLDDKPAGPAVDIVRRIQEKINTDEEIQILPWARGYKKVQQQPNVVLFSTTRTPEREKMFKWVGPIVEKRFSLYAKKGAQMQIEQLEDAQQYTIGVVRGSNNEQFLVSHGFTDLIRGDVEKTNLLLLQRGRFDLWYTDTAQASALMVELSLEGAAEEMYVIHKSRSYYAFNLDTPDNIVKQWQDALDELREEGTVMDILAQYKLESLYAVSE